MMTFNNRLRHYRKRKRLTQEQLAKELGIKRSTYAKYETGENKPDYNTLKKIADFFEISTDELLGRSFKNETDGFNALKEIDYFLNELGFKTKDIFDIELWESLGQDDVEEIKRHFEWVAHKAKERKLNEKKRKSK